MGFSIGIVGKPSCGKTSFTNAACMTDFKEGSYPFTTIDANVGVAHVRSKCACEDFDVDDNPQNSLCMDGTRLIPVKLIDVAGLVPGAHEGRGMGNQFLDDLSQADVLIHIVDASGSLDSEGQEIDAGSYDPVNDVEFLEREITQWMLELVNKDWKKITSRARAEGAKLDELLLKKLSGLHIKRGDILKAFRETNLSPQEAYKWSEDDLLEFVHKLRVISKPIIIAANKIDRPTSERNLERLRDAYPENLVVPVSALAEKALRDLEKKGIISYIPGDDDFNIIESESLSPGEVNQLEKIRSDILKKFGGTGVQNILNRAVFDFLNMISVYPVHDSNSLTDSDGNVLPDVYLVPEGTTAREFAGVVHSDLEDSFLHAIDARTKMRISEKHELKDRDIIKIVSTKGSK